MKILNYEISEKTEAGSAYQRSVYQLEGSADPVSDHVFSCYCPVFYHKRAGGE